MRAINVLFACCVLLFSVFLSAPTEATNDATSSSDDFEAHGQQRKSIVQMWVAKLRIGRKPKAKTPNDLSVTLERGPCYGECPEYTLSIAGSGISFRGKDHVQHRGNATAKILGTKFETIANAVDVIDYFRLQNTYVVDASDLPWTAITIRRGGRTKTIRHYGAGVAQLDPAPPELTAFEELVDGVAREQGWIR